MKIVYILTIVIGLVTLISCEEGKNDLGSGGTGKAGSLARFAISGDYLYTVSTTDLSVYDISTVQTPKRLNKIPLRAFVETIFPKDSLLFFGTRSGMLIYDNSRPQAPEYISQYSHIYSCDPVVVDRNFAFVTLNSESRRCGRNNNRLDIIDISNLNNPKQIGEYNMISPKGLGVHKNLLFVCDDGLKSYKIDNINNIELISHFKDVEGYDVIPDEGHLLMIGKNGFYQYKYDYKGVEQISQLLID